MILTSGHITNMVKIHPHHMGGNHETSFMVKELQAAVDDWLIIRIQYNPNREHSLDLLNNSL